MKENIALIALLVMLATGVPNSTLYNAYMCGYTDDEYYCIISEARDKRQAIWRERKCTDGGVWWFTDEMNANMCSEVKI